MSQKLFQLSQNVITRYVQAGIQAITSNHFGIFDGICAIEMSLNYEICNCKVHDWDILLEISLHEISLLEISWLPITTMSLRALQLLSSGSCYRILANGLLISNSFYQIPANGLLISNSCYQILAIGFLLSECRNNKLYYLS